MHNKLAHLTHFLSSTSALWGLCQIVALSFHQPRDYFPIHTVGTLTDSCIEAEADS